MIQHIKNVLTDLAKNATGITVLTGAGISAESGIPTFRGPEGFWTIGSKEYHPQKMATYHMFTKKPDEVWTWYLYRMGICAQANPNPGHMALVEMEKIFGDRFTLITQNVDNLHLRAGNSPEKTFQVHGNVFFMRCTRQCSASVYRLPPEINPKARNESLTDTDRQLLKCPDCGALTRPHVLWFDETYDEDYYRFYSALQTARNTDLLLTVGTSGATNLPTRVIQEVYAHGGTIIDINIEDNPFAQIAEKSHRGGCIKAPSARALPEIVEWIRKM